MPACFDEHNLIYDYVRQGLLNIADFFIEQTQKAFASLKVEDIVLAGGIVSYIYNDQTDIDLGIVVCPETDGYNPDMVQQMFRYVNRAFPQKGYRFNLFARNIDYGLVEPSHFFMEAEHTHSPKTAGGKCRYTASLLILRKSYSNTTKITVTKYITL